MQRRCVRSCIPSISQSVSLSLSLRSVRACGGGPVAGHWGPNRGSRASARRLHEAHDLVDHVLVLRALLRGHEVVAARLHLQVREVRDAAGRLVAEAVVAQVRDVPGPADVQDGVLRHLADPSALRQPLQRVGGVLLDVLLGDADQRPDRPEGRERLHREVPRRDRAAVPPDRRLARLRSRVPVGVPADVLPDVLVVRQHRLVRQRELAEIHEVGLLLRVGVRAVERVGEGVGVRLRERGVGDVAGPGLPPPAADAWGGGVPADAGALVVRHEVEPAPLAEVAVRQREDVPREAVVVILPLAVGRGPGGEPALVAGEGVVPAPGEGPHHQRPHRLGPRPVVSVEEHDAARPRRVGAGGVGRGRGAVEDEVAARVRGELEALHAGGAVREAPDPGGGEAEGHGAAGRHRGEGQGGGERGGERHGRRSD
mmetsp:Transcript_9141/g.22437  ORF Transcript_9141/g.22437 Transcript_9141/m.22437 type:complete len:427 (+) Transcript_9141:151-1431(+)